MNNLTQIGRQLAAIWKQIGLNQRISIVLAGVAVVAGLSSLAWFSGRQDFSLLYGRLDDAEAGKIVAALQDAKVPFQIKPGGNIYIPADRVHQMRMQLAAKGLPQAQGGSGYELFDRANFGISDFAQRLNFKRAVEGELSRTIGQLEQIESSRVQIVFPENRLLVDQQRKPTASVFIKIRGSSDMPSSAVNSIRFLVANAVEGLSPNSVSVVDHRGNVLSENQDDNSVAGLSNGQFAARRNVEQYLTKKAEGMLASVLGAGQAVVRVAAEINWDSINRTEEKYDPDGQVIREDNTTDETTITSTSQPTVASPGTPSNANTGETNNASASNLNTSNTKKKVGTKKYEINKSTSTILQAAGGLKKVTASVLLAQRFTGTGKDRKAEPRQPEELKKLRQIVSNAIGTTEDGVVLDEITFNDQPAVEIATKLEKEERTQFLIETGQKLIYPGVALILGMMFFRTLKKTKSDDLPIGVAVGDLIPDGVGSEGFGGGSKKKKKDEVVTVEVLNRLIKENPASMTQAVRAWLGRNTTPTITDQK